MASYSSAQYPDSTPYGILAVGHFSGGFSDFLPDALASAPDNALKERSAMNDHAHNDAGYAGASTAIQPKDRRPHRLTALLLALGVSLVAVGGTGVTYLRAIEAQLEELERMRREMPQDARAVQAGLTRLESQLSAVGERLDHTRRAGEVDLAQLDEVGQQLEALAQEMNRAQRSLTDLESGVEARWTGLSRTVDATAALAEKTRDELGVLNVNLAGHDEGLCWREMVGPTVQLEGEASVGSGVLLESKPVEGEDGSFETLLLTAWHVVRDIRAGSERQDPPIRVAVYLEAGGVRHETAELLVYEPDLDVALLRLKTSDELPWVAILPTREELRGMHTFRDICAVGCPLGNNPIPTRGEIAQTDHFIDGHLFWMINAPTFVGNSGGGVYDDQSHALLGILSKIYTHGSLRRTVVPHMGLVVPMPQVYDWLEGSGFASLVPADVGRKLTVADSGH